MNMNEEEKAKVRDAVERLKHLPEEERNEIHRKLNEANTAMINSEFNTPDLLYVDLAFFRDLHLGTLLTLIKELPDPEAGYRSFLKGLKSYQLRLYDEIAIHFPELPFTEAQIRQRLHDPAFGNLIFDMATATQYFSSFRENLIQNVNHSHAQEKWRKKPVNGSEDQYYKVYEQIHVFVNTWPIKVDEDRAKFIGQVFNQVFKVDTTIACIDPLEMSVELYKTFEEFTTFHLKRFMDNDAIHAHVCQTHFTNRYFFSPLIVDPSVKTTVVGQQFRREHETLTCMMRVFYNFHWIQNARFCVDLSVFADEEAEKMDFDPLAPLPPLSE